MSHVHVMNAHDKLLLDIMLFMLLYKSLMVMFTYNIHIYSVHYTLLRLTVDWF
jgi:hypothetical protein